MIYNVYIYILHVCIISIDIPGYPNVSFMSCSAVPKGIDMLWPN